VSSAIRRALVAVALASLGAIALFVVAAPPERCPPVTQADLRASAGEAVTWMTANQAPDGTWLYEYDRAADQSSADYNVVRHAGVIESLYLADTYGFSGALDSADRGLQWALDNRVDRHGWTGVTDSSFIQAGTNALLLAGLVERRLTTGDTTHDELMEQLGNFLVAQTEPSGALVAYYDLEPDRPREGVYSKYYTGEAYWALSRMHRLHPDQGWGEVADRIGNYLATERDDAEDVGLSLPDHWAGYGLGETALFEDRPDGTPLTPAEVEYVREQAGLFGLQARTIAQRFGPWGALVRGTFVPRGGGYGVTNEGLAGLWLAATNDDRLADVRGPIVERASCVAALAIDAQADAAEAAGFYDEVKVQGAWYRDGTTRMDDQQHALSGLLLTIPMVEAEPSSGHPAPSAWLWVLVVIAVVNPVRGAFGVPRPGGDRGRAVRLAAQGTAIGAAVLLLVGSTSGWVLDVVDASRPSVRIGAGALCAISAAIDLARRPPRREPALDGWRAALIPVAVPLMARPAMLVAGLSVVADLGLWTYAAALAIGAVALTGVVWPLPEDGPGRVAARWSARLLAALAIGGSVLLIVDGVYDI
jgi:small neutral amino acid transporter SnatA (MarC family)